MTPRSAHGVVPGGNGGPEKVPALPGLLDDRSSPGFRDAFGRLITGASRAQVAVRRIRLSGVDLRSHEVQGLGTLRVLTTEVNAHSLGLEAEALARDSARRSNLALVRRLFERGVVEVRAAPLGGWSPDFSIFHTPEGPAGLLVGPHRFDRSFPLRGPALASVHGPESARRLSERFESLWEDAYEVGPAVLAILERAPTG